MVQRENSITRRIQLLCAACGPAAIVLAFIGWLLAGLLPLPLGAHNTEAEVVAFYRDHSTAVRAGLVLAGIGLGGVLPLVGVISVQMMRMEGRYPILSFIQLACGAGTGVLLLIPMLLMTIAGFRPDRSPEITLTLNDAAWLLFITPIMPFIIQNIAIGVATLNDRNGIFPRWSGYLNLLVGFSFLPDVLPYFFYSGPFAWDGIFVFWLALTTYTIWMITMGILSYRAVLSDPNLAEATLPSSSPTKTAAA
ncbi:MAG TPA: hypothetical protein VMK12_10740 [Anaeromyxobacteraceae bacterium]|nr:hypothetical protein [Anaeromyxobacteraceae bacterium]